MIDINLQRFKKYLSDKGVEIQPTTNEWEILRFKTSNGVSIIYTNKAGKVTFTGDSAKAYEAYKAGRPWKPEDRKRAHMRDTKARLATRDGKKCFCCLKKLPFDALTVEHLLSFSHGGTNNDNNLCLLCEPCNKTLGNKAIAKKILIIIEQRRLAELANITFESTPRGDNFFHRIFKAKS